MAIRRHESEIRILLHGHVSISWRAKIYRNLADLNHNGTFEPNEKKYLSDLVLKNSFSTLTLYRPKAMTFNKPQRSLCQPLDQPGSEYPFECTFLFVLPRSDFPYGFARLVSSVPLGMPLSLSESFQILFKRARNFLIP